MRMPLLYSFCTADCSHFCARNVLVLLALTQAFTLHLQVRALLIKLAFGQGAHQFERSVHGMLA